VIGASIARASSSTVGEDVSDADAQADHVHSPAIGAYL
jgi:hypothetical protein